MPRPLPVLLLLAALSYAQDNAPPLGDKECTCDEGFSSYEALGCPRRAPGDPSVCPLVDRGLSPKMWRKPKGLGPEYDAPSMESFLLRHAVSWRIQCSLCAYTDRKKRDGPREEHSEAINDAEKQRRIGGKRIEVALSPHFAVVTDIPRLKIRTEGGGVRVADQHELLHLYCQRAELARRDFVRVFGPVREMRSLVVLVWSESTRRVFSDVHWGHPDQHLLYGGGSGKRDLPGGAGNGYILSGRDDDELNFIGRHMIGHLAISTYHHPNPFEKHLPQWLFAGAAHWLCKLHPRAEDFVYFCSDEGVTVSGSGSRWDDKARKLAARGPSRDPVEGMFQAATAKAMDFYMHVRAWSWFDVFTREEPEPFVRFVQMIRDAKEPRVASKEAWGQPPELVDERWRERVLGKRDTVAMTRREERKDTDVDEATRRELREISRETNVALLCGRIRGLDRPKRIETARVLLSLIDSRSSDRVAEVIALVLSRTDDPEVLAYLRGEGYERAGDLGRATLCRTFGAIKHAEAVPLLRKALSDSDWLVRANAARALALLGDTEAVPRLAELAANDKPKVRIGAMDALGGLGAAAADTIPAWESNLMHRDWQVKVATCDAFRAIGSTQAMDMLIGRIDSEGGRVHDAIKRAIKALTGMDRDWNREEWRKWWNKAKDLEDLRKRMEEELAKERREAERKKDGERRTVAGKKDGPPTYYGIRVYARTVGFVLDTSESMDRGFEVSQEWQERLGRKYTATTRMGVCKEEIAHAIRALDPRTRINLVFFNDRVRLWKPTPVPAGTMGENAIGIVSALTPSGQTNYYDALRAIMGFDDGGPSWREAFPDAPDTLFFLTDGQPTDGEITRSDELLSWFNERNRFARLRVHVIAMGNTGIDLDFLRRLAESNDGTFLHLTGTY